MSERLSTFFSNLFSSHSVTEWIFSILLFVVVFSGVPILRTVIRRRCPGDDASDRSVRGLVGRLNGVWMRFTTVAIGVLLAAMPLSTSAQMSRFFQVSLIVVLAIQFVRLAPVIVDWSLLRMMPAKVDEEEARNARASVTGVRWLVLFVVYAFTLLVALQNMGVDVTSLVAGLGIGGIAVALALQNILGDLFASLTISLDKPFSVGDFIIVGSEMGTVEYVGLKTTRVRSLSGEQLVFGNADLLASRIRNYKRMRDRRVVFAFGVEYATPAETLERINDIVKSAIGVLPNLRFDRCHFHRFGPSSYDFEAVYYINSPDYNAHMDAHQAVHLAIVRAFRSERINFAYPTQMLYLARSDQ